MHHHNTNARTVCTCVVDIFFSICVVVWGFDKKTVAVLREMQGKIKSHLSQENSDAAAAEKVLYTLHNIDNF
jgi:RNase H-fold protein (predicted Holliday junction resolvase)